MHSQLSFSLLLLDWLNADSLLPRWIAGRRSAELHSSNLLINSLLISAD
jgi:hypothetical protein